jgi:adenylate kinase
LVFGVPGVGKTTACQAYVGRHPETLFISASSLLKAAHQTSGEALRTAGAAEIVSNQQLLGAALAAFRKGREDRPVLIDAHAVIDNDQELVRVPVETIGSLVPDRLILLEAAACTVAQRRLADLRRRPVRNLKLISDELAAERATVESYAEALGLTLLVADVKPDFRLDALLT